jgi:hypothetical protein
MPFKQQLLAVLLSLGLLVFIVDAVRRRKLREEYAWLWILVGAVIAVLSLWQSLLDAITGLMGIQLPVNTVFFFGLVFIVFINLHFSIRISRLTNEVKRLTQEIAIIAEEKPAAGETEPERE